MTLDDSSLTLEPDTTTTAEPATSKEPRHLGEVERKSIVDTYAALRAGIPGFRTRRAQSEMIAATARALGNDGGAAVVEAGTGTGKSLAYLTAGMTLATMHERTLLIATGTVGLQEQLSNRDIPMFGTATKIDGEPVIAKGRNRYACPRNMQVLSANSGDQGVLGFGMDDDLGDAAGWPRAPRKGEPERVQKLFARLESGKWDGDLDNPPLRVDERLWPLLTTTSGGCTGRKCAFYRQCPYFRARAKVGNATVIVANHALLLADLQFPREADEGKFGGVLLPPLEDCLLVVDEGHQLTQTAISASASSSHLSSLLRRAAKWQGFIRASFNALGRDTIARAGVTEALGLVKVLTDAVKALESEIRGTWVPEPKDGAYAEYRGPLGNLPEGWRDRAADVREATVELSRVVKGIRRALNDADDLNEGARMVLPREIGAMHERLTELGTVTYWWSRESNPDAKGPPVAKWVRLGGSDQSLVLCSSPTSAAGLIRERIFDQAAGVLVTSATLSAGGDFRQVAGQLGLPKHGETLSLPSPFDYERQAVLQVPWIQAAPNDQEGHAREVVEWMQRELAPTAGNLVLFNSKVKMNRVAELLEGPIKKTLRVQHTKPKAELLAEHTAAVRAGTGSTLLGLAGLGEGTDLPGDLCTTLVVVNLPFRVPTDPVEATYAEWLESRGRRPFDEVTVPGAIRILTQYVGRLLRHEDDEGRVVILDRRIVDKAYGRRMLNALPAFRREIDPRPRHL